MRLVSVPEVLVISSDDEDAGHGTPDDDSVFGDVAATLDWSDDDCLVLDRDPDKPAGLAANDDNLEGDDSDDVFIVAEKGELACRDYPHPRYLCARFPFSSTAHEKHCDLCHCYVCDSPAPCELWSCLDSLEDHCHSTDEGHWKYLREMLMLEKIFKGDAHEPSDTNLSKGPPLQNTVSTGQHQANSSSPSLISKVNTLRHCPPSHGAACTPVSRSQHSVPIDKISRGQKVDERTTKRQSSLSGYHREKHGAGALDAQFLPLHTKDRRVGTSGSTLTGHKTKPLQQNVYNRNRSSGVTTITKRFHGQKVDERLRTQLSSLSGALHVQKEKHVASTVNARVVQQYAKNIPVGTTGNSPNSNTTKQVRHGALNHNRPSGCTAIVNTSRGQKVDEHPMKELSSLSRAKHVQQEKHGLGELDAHILQSHTEVRRVTRSSEKQLKHRVPSHYQPSVSTAIVKKICGKKVDEHRAKRQSSLFEVQHVQREKRADSALDAQVVQSYAKVRRVGTTGSRFSSNSMRQSSHNISDHHRSNGATTQRS